MTLSRTNQNIDRSSEPPTPDSRVFLRHLQHETRTPLTTIIGFAHLIQDRAEDIDMLADLIARSGEKLLSVLDNVTRVFAALNAEHAPAAAWCRPSRTVRVEGVRRIVDEMIERHVRDHCDHTLAVDIRLSDDTEVFVSGHHVETIIQAALESAVRHAAWQHRYGMVETVHLHLTIGHENGCLTITAQTADHGGLWADRAGPNDADLSPDRPPMPSGARLPRAPMRASIIEDTLLNTLSMQVGGSASVTTTPSGAHVATASLPAAHRTSS